MQNKDKHLVDLGKLLKVTKSEYQHVTKKTNY